MTHLTLNHDALTKPERILTVFQPWVSIKTQSVIGVESLSRGILREHGVIIPPYTLFNMVPDADSRLKLDRLCRILALERFAPIHTKRRDMLISINVDTSLISHAAIGSEKLLETAKRMGISPNNVVIEIIESHVTDMDALREFIKTYRDRGFLIALDDVGAGHSNLDRIPEIKPDIIKIDRGLIRNIHNEHHKREIAHSLVRLARGIGAMVIAEGVEEEAEVLSLMELGVDIFQGFYFAKPEVMETPPPVPKTVRSTARAFRRRIVESIAERKRRHEAYDKAASSITAALGTCAPRDFDRNLATCIHSHPDIECLYVINRVGRQVSATMCNPDVIPEARRFIYQPAPKGTDHSLKEYYLSISAGLPRFTTEPYLSLASGNPCLTISTCFKDHRGHNFILCMDVACR